MAKTTTTTFRITAEARQSLKFLSEYYSQQIGASITKAGVINKAINDLANTVRQQQVAPVTEKGESK